MRVLALLMVAGCVDGNHTLALTVTTPEGDVVEERVSGPTAWVTDEQGKTSASWPAEGEIGDDTLVALATAFSPYQPGLTKAAWTSLTYDGTPYTTLSDGAAITVERVAWTGNRHYPFVQRGRLEGEVDGFAYTGTFDLGPADCEGGGPGCGEAMADVEAELSRTIEAWTDNTCPSAVTSLYIDGGALTLSVKDGARIGEADALDCVVTDKASGRVICGADDVVKVDGCKWAVTAVATPGVDGGPPDFALYAGSIGDCAPETCAVSPAVVTPEE